MGVLSREVVEHVGVITFNRPERHNAFDDELGEEFAAAVTWAASDPEVRVVLLRGEGRSFSSGRDTGQLGQRAAGETDFGFVREHQDRRLAQIDCPKPVVAALKGHVLGGGLEVALAADIRLASTDLSMGFPEVGYGLMTDTGGAGLATILAGPSRAKLLLMTGERIDAAQALAWGLVDRVVEPERLDEEARLLCERLAAQPPLAVAMVKQVVDEVWHGQLHAAVRAELLAQTALFSSTDYREARAAGREKRPGRYEGR